MKDNQDRLVILKRKYQGEVSELEMRLQTLRGKLKSIDELEADSVGLSAPESGKLKYSGWSLGLIDAVEDAIKSLGMVGGTAPKVAKQLTDNGYVPKGKNFNISVSTALKRLEADKKKVVSDKKNGSRIYIYIE